MSFPRRNVKNVIENPGELLASNLVECCHSSEQRKALIAKVRSTEGGEKTIKLAYDCLKYRKMQNDAAVTANNHQAEYWSKVCSPLNLNISESSKVDTRVKLKAILIRGDNLMRVSNDIKQVLNLLGAEVMSGLYADAQQDAHHNVASRCVK